MRNNNVKYDKKSKMFRAYTSIASRAYVASEETLEMLGWHMYAEDTEEYMSLWLKDGRDDPDYLKQTEGLRVRLADDDLAFMKARRAFWNRHLNS